MDIRDAADSKVISNIMAKKKSHIEMESRVAVAGNMQTAQLAEVAAAQAVSIRNQESAEAVAVRTAAKTRTQGIAEQEARQAISEAQRLTATKEMAVLEVQNVRKAEIDRASNLVVADQQRQVAVISADANKQQRVISAEAQKESAVIDAEGTKQQKILTAEGDKAQTALVAEGNLVKAQLNAKGIEAEGAANGAAQTAVLMAPVTTQIALAEKIGSDAGYQTYLVSIRGIERDQAIGVAQAAALEKAEIKVIANAGNVTSGVTSAMDLLSSKGGTQLGAMVEAFKQTPAGAEVLRTLNGH
jgi:flotillin